MKAFCLGVRLLIELSSCHTIIWCWNEQQKGTGASYDSMQNIFTQLDQVILSLTWMIMKTVLCSTEHRQNITHRKACHFHIWRFHVNNRGDAINGPSLCTIFASFSLSFSLPVSLLYFSFRLPLPSLDAPPFTSLSASYALLYHTLSSSISFLSSFGPLPSSFPTLFIPNHFIVSPWMTFPAWQICSM